MAEDWRFGFEQVILTHHVGGQVNSVLAHRIDSSVLYNRQLNWGRDLGLEQYIDGIRNRIHNLYSGIPEHLLYHWICAAPQVTAVS